MKANIETVRQVNKIRNHLWICNNFVIQHYTNRNSTQFSAFSSQETYLEKVKLKEISKEKKYIDKTNMLFTWERNTQCQNTVQPFIMKLSLNTR